MAREQINFVELTFSKFKARLLRHLTAQPVNASAFTRAFSK
jgi:hypothetical protein